MVGAHFFRVNVPQHSSRTLCFNIVCVCVFPVKQKQKNKNGNVLFLDNIFNLYKLKYLLFEVLKLSPFKISHLYPKF